MTKLPPLTPERQALVEANLKYAAWYLKKRFLRNLLRRGLEPPADADAMLGEAQLGLVMAAATYDFDRGPPFVAFARYRVKGRLWREYARQMWGSQSDLGRYWKGFSVAPAAENLGADAYLVWEEEDAGQWSRLDWEMMIETLRNRKPFRARGKA